MQIQPKDYFHGAALTQIVEHKSFKALNKADEKYGHYKINNDIRLMVKTTSINEDPWQFTANASDLEVMETDINSGDKFFLCLVCGLSTICLLNSNQVQELLDIHSREQQWLKVKNTGSLRAYSTRMELRRTIPHNAFPDTVFST